MFLSLPLRYPSPLPQESVSFSRKVAHLFVDTPRKVAHLFVATGQKVAHFFVLASCKLGGVRYNYILNRRQIWTIGMSIAR